MDDNDFAATEVPRKRGGWLVRKLANASIAEVIVCGMVLYLSVVLFFSIIEVVVPYDFVGREIDAPKVAGQEGGKVWARANFGETLYFNFITILTIGYGDFAPVGAGRFLAILEAVIGTGIIGLTIAALTAKLMSAPRDAVVFSRFGYYSEQDERFLVIFVNTTHSPLTNFAICDYFKLGGDWEVTPAVRSPYVTQAVQTFFICAVPISELTTKLREGDALRVGISTRVGDATFATAIEYKAKDIVVIPNRDALTSYDGFWKPALHSKEFLRMFHYRPEGARSLVEYVGNRRPAGMKTTP